MALQGNVNDTTAISGTVAAVPAGNGSGGTTDHSKLSNRDAAGQHPISAISGLEQKLEDLDSGSSGIHVGPDEPTDDNIVVWIDPESEDTSLLVEAPATAKVGQTIVVKAVDENGAPTEWEAATLPDKLPNPNPLEFTGAATGTYDGSAPLTVNIPEGGGSSPFKKLLDITTEEEIVSVLTNVDADGNAFAVKELVWRAILPTYKSAVAMYFGISSPNTYGFVWNGLTYLLSQETTSNTVMGGYMIMVENALYHIEASKGNTEYLQAPMTPYGQFVKGATFGSPTISGFVVGSSNIQAKLPVGTKIIVWGR